MYKENRNKDSFGYASEIKHIVIFFHTKQIRSLANLQFLPIYLLYSSHELDSSRTWTQCKQATTSLTLPKISGVEDEWLDFGYSLFFGCFLQLFIISSSSYSY